MITIAVKGVKSFSRKAKKIERYFKAEMRKQVLEMEKDLHDMFEENFKRGAPLNESGILYPQPQRI